MNIGQYEHAFAKPLDMIQLAGQVPAAFSDRAADNTSNTYVFISTRELVGALLDAGFIATQARQTNVRAAGNADYARHLLRFQHARESVTLVDAIPQIVLINSHDGRCSYQLRAGLYRPVCANGLLTRLGDFGLIHVPHRGNIIQNVVEGALALVRNFDKVGQIIERMNALKLDTTERLKFAQDALRVRYHHEQYQPVQAEQLLMHRRAADEGCDVWRTYNVVQENVMRGGVPGRSVTGKTVYSRGIRAIREDVRINNALWQLAVELLRR
jgi:Domain of unknown function (DUF932)